MSRSGLTEKETRKLVALNTGDRSRIHWRFMTGPKLQNDTLILSMSGTVSRPSANHFTQNGDVPVHHTKKMIGVSTN